MTGRWRGIRWAGQYLRLSLGVIALLDPVQQIADLDPDRIRQLYDVIQSRTPLSKLPARHIGLTLCDAPGELRLRKPLPAASLCEVAAELLADPVAAHSSHPRT
jgi:hypothetical protein